MVLLAMSAFIVEAIESLPVPKNGRNDFINSIDDLHETTDNVDRENSLPTFDVGDITNDHETRKTTKSREFQAVINDRKSNFPDLSEPMIGNPITHRQVIALSKSKNSRNHGSYSLETLLRGSSIYIPSPSPKSEKTSEYKSLMARLRREEEARLYQKITRPTRLGAEFVSHFPDASSAHAFTSDQSSYLDESDNVTYADINRQLTLILNILISIIACGSAIWIVAKFWSTPMRLALSMSGSFLVGLAEIIIYSGYIRRVGEAKTKENKIREIKEVIKTWVIGADDNATSTNNHQVPVMLDSKKKTQNSRVRRRK